MTLATGLRAFWTASPWGPARVSPAPSGLTGVPSSSGVILTWSLTEDVISYTILRNGVEVGSVDGGTLTYTDSGLESSTSYVYTLRANYSTGTTQAVTLSVRTTRPTPPSVVFTQTYNIGTATSYTIPVPTGLQHGDLLMVQAVHGNNTQTIPFSVSGWTQMISANSAATGAHQIYYARYWNGTTITPFVATYTGSTANSVLRILVIRGAAIMRTNQVYQEPFNYLSPNTMTTAAHAAGATVTPVVPDPINGFGTLIQFEGFLASSSVNLDVTPLSGQTVHDSGITTNIHPVVLEKPATSVNDSLATNFSLSSAAQRAEITIWVPGNDTTRFYRPTGAGSQSGGASTSETVGVTGYQVDADDSVIIYQLIPAGTGAVGCTAPAGWTAPIKLVDSGSSNSGLRTVLWWSRPTAEPSTGNQQFTVTHPSASVDGWGAYILKKTKGVVPVGATKTSALATDTVSTAVAGETFSVAFVSGMSGFAPGTVTFTKPTDFSRMDYAFNNTSNLFRAVTTGGQGLAVFTGEQQASGTVNFTTTIGGGPASITRSLITFTGSELYFGPPAEEPTVAFAAFGIPL